MVTGLAAADVVASDTVGDITLMFTKVPRRVDVADQLRQRHPGIAARPHRLPDPRAYLIRQPAIQVAQSPASSHVITAHNSNGDITIGYW